MSDTTSNVTLVLDKPKSRDDWVKAPEWALIPKEELSIKLEVLYPALINHNDNNKQAN